MPASDELAELFRRDLTRLLQELEAFPADDLLWRCPPGVTNSPGNLFLHLEGNLREFIGRQLGGIPYQRQREIEFSATGLSRAQLAANLTPLLTLIPAAIAPLTPEALAAIYPQVVLGKPLTTNQFLVHLSGHLNYHLGQIDYLRRILTAGASLPFAGLTVVP